MTHHPTERADATNRPHQHLCPEADARDAMTDAEFWSHVWSHHIQPTWDHDAEGPDFDVSLNTTPCDECGATGACAYDAEGRALIHATTDADDLTDGAR